ncbi:MAG: hypothetical protein Q8K63_08350, partial [Acidimicrobiales bacterium]|nr:hypothetical protein [Acidimicrobiales bacterium]
MLRFRNALVVVLFAAAVFFGRGVPAHACSCLPATYDEHFAKADAVFDGITKDKVGNDVASTYQFQVVDQLKGSVPNPASVRTPANSAACGDNFEKDVAYRLFVRKEGNDLTTNLCMGNIKTTDAPKLTTTTVPPKPTTTAAKPIAATTTAVDPTTTSSSTTTVDDQAVTINSTDDGGGSGWVLPVVGAAAVAALAGGAFYLRSRRA